MKILLIAPQNRRRIKLTRWLNRHDAVIVGMGCFRGIQILQEIARCNPHVVIYAEKETDSDSEAVLSFIAEKFRSVSLVRLPVWPGDRDLPPVWTDFILKVLKSPLPAIVPQDYASETRLVFHDPLFDQYAWAGKLTSGALSDDYQVAKLFLLLDGGRNNHQQAKNYLAAVEATLPGLYAELAYRWAHKSYKGLSWARDMVAKFISVVVFYIPSVEVRHLPHPSPIAPSVDYVHYFQPHDCHYALSALTQLRINSAVAELLIASSQWVFNGQGGVTLSAEQCQLVGLAKMMHEVARAHVDVMDRWLIPDGVKPGEELSRDYHRKEGIVRDFFDWGNLFEERSKLAGLLNAYHRKTWKPEYVFSKFPGYGEFVDKYTSERNE